MAGLIREDITSVIKKKRFIILTALLFIGAIVMVIITKNKLWNDQTFFFCAQKYINYVFSPLIGVILIISVYRRKYTKNSILMVETHGKKRSAGVFSKLLSGAVILIITYLLMTILMLLLGLILGAGLSTEQTKYLIGRLIMDCFAAIASYAAVLFFLYLFAFPVFPAILYFVLMFAVSFAFGYIKFYTSVAYEIASIVVPKVSADYVYTEFVFSHIDYTYLILFVIQVAIPFLLSIMVFHFKKKTKKKKKRSRRKKKGGEPEELSEEVGEEIGEETDEIVEEADEIIEDDVIP